VSMPNGRRLRVAACSAITSKLNVTLAAAVALTFAVMGTNTAAAAEPYGEVTRFGGPVNEFASSAISPQDEGRFVLPVGFAVEPQNPSTGEKNAVYVLDQTLSDTATGELDYRLQKISSVTHEVLGSTTIEEKYTDKTNFSDVHPLVGLAVDAARKRVYTIESSMVNLEGSTYVPVVGKLVAWSTEPEAITKKLVRAAPGELTEEDPITKASVVANESTFKVNGSLNDVLYAPAGLAVESSANGDVAIEAQEGVSSSGEGPTTIQLVDTNGSLGKHWTDSNAVSGRTWAGNGVFAGSAAEEFGVDLYTASAKPSNLATVAVGADTSKEVTATAGEDRDQALSVSLNGPLSKLQPEGEDAFREVVAAGTPVVQLAGGKLYAALFAQPESEGLTRESQTTGTTWKVEENGKLKEPYVPWVLGEVGGGLTEQLGNIGVRLFELNGTEPKIVDTIGGGEPNPANPSTPVGDSQLGSCNIDYRMASLAAGAEGAVFVLTEPRGDFPFPGSYEYDDEVIEFAPGGTHACPGIQEGNVEVKEGANWKELQKGGEPEPSLTVDEGVPVTLSAKSLDHLETNRTWQYTAHTFTWSSVYEWTPFAFEWNMEGKSTGGPGNDGYTIVNKMEENSEHEWPWPSPEVIEYSYGEPGIYHASVRVDGDRGMKEFPFIVHVLGSIPPEAKFSCQEAGGGKAFTVKAGKALACDAAESKPTPGTEVEYYKWQFGDGSAEVNEPGGPTIKHTFAKAGKDTVVLKIRDKAGTPAESVAVSHEVTVEPGEVATTTTSSSSQTSTSNATVSTTTTKTTSTSTTDAGSGKSKPTKAQELAKALKACKKDKSKKKRLSCEKAAKKKYAPPKKKANGKAGKGSKRK
jgi:hypothetical protein